jgi:hypothetical protein
MDLAKPHTLRPVLLLFLVFHPGFSSAGELYKWVDAEGTVHMTDSPSQIPPQYRNQVDRKQLQTAAEPGAGAEFRKARSAADLRHFEIPYQPFGGNSRRIIIPVRLNDSVTAQLLLDTGSPGLMISPKLASRLGLLDDDQDGNLRVMTGGIGGSVPAILSVVDNVSVGEARS